MTTGSESASGHRMTPVSVDDVARVLSRALSARTWRIRLFLPQYKNAQYREHIEDQHTEYYQGQQVAITA